MTAVSDATALWWIGIGIGVVVAACVVVLLSLLTAFVADIDRHVGVVGTALGHVAANTGTVSDLRETGRLIGALETELEAHVRALSTETGPR